MSVSIKKKRVSKKNKSAWRKHTDIKDVEQFLEDQRQEERIGTFSDKKDEELFIVDKPVKKQLVSERVKRKLNATKPVRGFLALENTSKVTDPIVKRNHVNLKKNGRNIENEITNPKTQVHVQANKDRRKYNEKLDKKINKDKTEREFSEDIWAEKDILADYPALKSHWVSKPLALYTLRNIGKGVTKIHDSIRHRTTKAKKFEPPHPGMSYNPSLKDHQDLITKVLNKEEEIIKEEKHLKRVTTQMFTKMTEGERDMAILTELTSGLPVEDGGSGGSDIDDNEELQSIDETKPYESVNPPVLNKKKDRKTRRKQKEQRILKTENLLEKTSKKRASDLNRLKKLKDEVITEEQQLKILMKHRKRVDEKKKYQTKRLGKLKFKESDIEVNMKDDIAGNLRNVKPESNLLVDRFKNFQKRNILPTSVDLGSRKRKKIKRFVRSSHKEPQQPLPKKKINYFYKNFFF